ncbi:MAG: hypothetical protein JXR76_16875 [Deltaproteobacteria bacterium]|nr:hypothetical protein [Deltaproteobacteria bacterium]
MYAALLGFAVYSFSHPEAPLYFNVSTAMFLSFGILVLVRENPHLNLKYMPDFRKKGGNPEESAKSLSGPATAGAFTRMFMGTQHQGSQFLASGRIVKAANFSSQ